MAAPVPVLFPSPPAPATVRVEKATSELLLGPDWTLNIDICDSVNSDYSQAKDVIKATKKRLQHKNPQVQMLALTLLETLIKNCGDHVHLQVVERDIPQEMVKIVRKKADMHVRDKILILLDCWQEAFGPKGKYPQYFLAYADLKASGVEFPERSPDLVPIFTSPTSRITHSTNVRLPTNSSRDEAMSPHNSHLSLADLSQLRSASELLRDMLRAINQRDRLAVKDEVITDLVSQCHSGQRKILDDIDSIRDEELLAQALEINDRIQSLLAEHDAIASGNPPPVEVPQPFIRTAEPVAPHKLVVSEGNDEDDEDDEFAQLARRNSKIEAAHSEGTPTGTGQLFSVDDAVIPTSASLEISSTLSDAPTSERSARKEDDMINLLSLSLLQNPSESTLQVPLTHSASQVSSQGGAPNTQEQDPSDALNHTPQLDYAAASFAPHFTQPQQPDLYHIPSSQPQFDDAYGSSTMPPPPWAVASEANPFLPAPFEPLPIGPNATPGSSSFANAALSAPPEKVQASMNSLQPASLIPSKPSYIPANKLFQELVERNADGSLKAGNQPK